MNTDFQPVKPKSFWQRPEGVTGGLFLVAGIAAAAYYLLPILNKIVWEGVNLAIGLGVLGGLVYILLDPKVRNLVWYMYKSIMRWITGIFVQIDPIGILKSYIDDLKSSLGKMSTQIANLKGQMYKLSEMIKQNQRDIQNNLGLASKAKEVGRDSIMVLKARKAGRLQESNMKLDDLYKRMEVLYRVLVKMYENSEAKSVAHADYIYDEFNDWSTGGWFMCESKAKELSILEYRERGPRPQAIVNKKENQINS
jgi:hypothetical protein